MGMSMVTKTILINLFDFYFFLVSFVFVVHYDFCNKISYNNSCSSMGVSVESSINNYDSCSFGGNLLVCR